MSDNRILDAETIAELSRAFEPASMEGLAKRLWELGPEISKLERERDNLRNILKEHCETSGEVVEVAGLPPLRLARVARFRSGVWSEELSVRFDRKR